ncbi:MAG: cbb3-type cytochrome c oxidase subunit I [Syntrophaceae bacterium]
MAETTVSNGLVNKEIVRLWLIWGFFWAVFAPLVGILLSLMFNFPDYMDTQWTHFGRLRPVHVNGVIFGVFSTIFLGLVYYMVPKLAGIRMYGERWSAISLWLWNGTLLAAFASLLLGYNKGLEVAEFPNPLPMLQAAALFLIAWQVFMTIARRKEEKIFVSLWYIIAALVWTGMNLLYGNLVIPYAMPGIHNVALHGLYIHYVVGLWITPAGLAVIYFFLPASARSPLYSHKLSLIGFWSLAFFYPFVGIHHYLYSPIPAWTQTIAIVASMMLIIPVWTVVANFFGTLKGKWGTFQTDFTVKLMIFGAVMYFIGSTQGSLEALRSIQQPTHFTDFVIAHSHATVFGGYVIWVLAACYYVWPRVAKGTFHVFTARLSTWLIMGGISTMIFILTVQGLIQGTTLMAGAEFVDSIQTMKPYWMIRTATGVAMDVGIALVGINLLLSARRAGTSMGGTP